MILKSIVLISFLLILISLGSALFHLVKHKDESEKTAKALTYRITLSLILFILVFIAFATGLVKPSGLGTVIHKQALQQTNN